ncbi:MAG: hypothetical protein KUA43_05215 [Hoeflea sp.]|uniref:helix-turn-helix domain-containing protein n=1 Tax=Hoeflea sp. TaxID=1940281 RepID=UPI001DEB426A|nr:hypothetical protein [Hoeflea sp.]MBU4530931.1 hypothetical protein [Alphaproteobacteria bacterium]MBU4542706.1 hypothetical protein [Alphaproteobacteria bacterium]MBU4549367.1 hypothetical protein [Alphaproteobacteria bacterium]MBV1722823.1 hypothetical protein [Hoeflea sp.]MBV1761545.1 hypothetical protein [Hoeflea sp.]
MTEYSFTFLVGGIDPQAENFEDVFFEAGCDDATIALMHRMVAVCFDREAESFADAVVSAYADLLKAGVQVLKFEPDTLVSQADIARRAGLTRAAVTNYVNGDRGTGFPVPTARIMTSSPLWTWLTVAGWLQEHGQLDATGVEQARAEQALFGLFADGSFSGTPAELRMQLEALLKPKRSPPEPRISLLA